MTDPESDRDDDRVSVRIPAALRDRVDAVFRAHRGYEPSSAQESLSLVCDLAERRVETEGGAAGLPPGRRTDRTSAARDRAGVDHVGARSRERHDRATDRTRTHDGVERTKDPGAGDGTGDAAVDGTPSPGTPSPDRDGTREAVALIGEVFPRDWDADPTVEAHLPAVVERYVDNPEGIDDAAERERDAVAAAAREADLAPERLRRQLVTSLYGGAGFPDGLAGEFFAEALSGAAEVAARPPVGTAEAASDGGVAGESGGSIDSLLADADAEPAADCERCGADHPVDDLETVIGPEDGSTVRLLCPDCAADAR